ncbi:trehalose-phosphatase [Stutzerimonas tarimensis]|uniref:Trehalose 6-phosphate phosphatase n=1 Tax=Stutzerimonas tarimensis TaxID=1507735 RepID=A0ABV7T059_9GAMM
MTDQHAPHAPDARRCSFFFDVDGTLAELQPRPEQVFIPASAIDALGQLQAAGVPVAVVSGRPIEQLDQLLSPLQLPAAGVHGAERRHIDGQTSLLNVDLELMAQIRHELADQCSRFPGLRLENKGIAFALHYREAPELQPNASALAQEFATRYEEALVLQPGKCVYELKPRGASKGEAISAFLEEPPFAGRLPVFIGDDLTDEAGFGVVNRLGGLSIKVGQGDTLANWRLDSVKDVHRWLAEVLTALFDPPPASHFLQESKGSP